jgi:hypothetical protein
MRAIFVLAAAMAGCYHYVPVDAADAVAGHTVRLRVDEAQARRFSSVVPVEGRTVQGKLIERSTDSLLLEVPIQTQLQGNRVETISQRIDLPNSSITNFELRQLDRGKTALVSVGGGAIIGAVVASTLSGAFRADREPDDGGTEIVVPLFLRIRF